MPRIGNWLSLLFWEAEIKRTAVLTNAATPEHIANSRLALASGIRNLHFP
jgi:hypothetical protein